ncbi:hypothetical protein GGD66_008013 [Bradyrhizobium sp. CIR48]|uniref:hypothetical protein n=1 Tax=unclassified Bradyrhizobium TaxID=2631580 RepID=UPI00160573A3|nr:MULTISPECIES: hypothetical protein [unclassified Bradyrhizobium]MBB4366908.1 hypothetical protein [Bradyrhizobium sp. CIR18]MBB4429411.1 hypothetical protein [Bradyrhizobium sp. CIR48]
MPLPLFFGIASTRSLLSWPSWKHYADASLRLSRRSPLELNNAAASAHDPLPLAVWFEDISDLSAGLGYASEDAYENPIAKLAFHGAHRPCDP